MDVGYDGLVVFGCYVVGVGYYDVVVVGDDVEEVVVWCGV